MIMPTFDSVRNSSSSSSTAISGAGALAAITPMFIIIAGSVIAASPLPPAGLVAEAPSAVIGPAYGLSNSSASCVPT